MMKAAQKMKGVENDVADALRALIEQVDFLEIISIDQEPTRDRDSPVVPPDLIVDIRIQERPVTLICEVKDPGYPRQIRQAISQLHGYIAVRQLNAIPMVAASWLSPESRQLCVDGRVNYLDLAGNCRLLFDGVHIERETSERPKAAARTFRSIFSPKSAQILRVLLRDPARPWKVSELAAAADVSLGQVSNVRSALIEREWATADNAGLHLTNPAALLDAWRQNYEPLRGERTSWYTILHGRELEQALRNILAHGQGQAMLASLSAANWLVPFVRGGNTYLYADNAATPGLIDALKLKPVSTGANVQIIIPDDPTIFSEKIDAGDGVAVAPPVLTYLDLSLMDDRAREAADHLRERLLTWQ
jgi:hypothetical protein